MFHLSEVTWPVFFTTLLLLMMLYWIVIGLKYYRRDLFKILNRQQGPKKQNNQVIHNPFEAEIAARQNSSQPENYTNNVVGPDEQDESEMFPKAYELVQEIKLVLKDGARKRWIRQELVQGLQGLLKNPSYAPLKATAFQNAIRNLIEIESKNTCGIELTPEEIQVIW